ncbi:MAG: PQQ-binding-like beta-propeller repeat protein [Gammaproteobacteria bacterium]
MRLAVVLSIALLIAGCVSSDKKEYPKLDSIKPSVNIQTLWVANVGEKGARQYRQLSIAIADDRVYAAAADGHLKALQQSDGKVAWANAIADSISAGPVVKGNVLYVGTTEAHVFALDAKSGRIVWKGDVSSEVLSNPVVDDKFVYVQTIDGKVTALDKTTGKKVWSDSRVVPALTLRGTSSPIIAENRLIAGFADGKLVALEKETGKRLWEAVVGLPTGRTDLQRMVDIDGLMQVSNDEVYAVTYQGRISADGAGYVHWLSKEDGAVVARDDLADVYDHAFYDWGDEDRAELDFGVSSALEVVKDRLYVRNNMGSLSVFQLSSPVN